MLLTRWRNRARAVGMLLLAGGAAGRAQRAPAKVPPNTAASVTATDSTLTLRYNGAVVFDGVLKARGGSPRLRQLVDSSGGRVTQIVSWMVRDGQLELRGVVHGTADAIAVDADPREDALPVVRNSVGPSYNLLNRGVYARTNDWLFSVDFPARVRITPVAGNDSSAFQVQATGFEITLRFRPRYYQRHRGLAAYEPWTYQPWKRSVAGWTSWFAFLDKVTEQDVHEAADVLAERLAPYGYEYLQIDDGFQQVPISTPDHWLQTNAKFPGGLSGLRSYIAGKGLTPGLWTNTTFHDSSWANAHPAYFVRNADGTPAWGNWVGYVMDGSQRATMQDLVLPVYRQLKSQGWGYYKVDALRHLRYEGYNSHAAAFASRGLDRVAVYRSFVQQIRDAIGRSSFLLASWGPRPELIGIIDATRLGDDGFGYGAFSQFNSFNNIVWRNDPDHIEIHRADGYRSATITSLTGSLLMLTDKPSVYRTDRVEAARRAAPVLFTQPGQVYDLDPSRSSRLAMVNHEVSGSGPRPFEADQQLQQTLYQLDVSRAFEQWTVLARTPGAPNTIAVADLGLPTDRPHVVFDFWNQRVVGTFADSLRLPAVDSLGVQVLCLHRQQDHPQVLATNRHVSCGGVDLEDVRWERGTLSGRSHTVGGDAYVLFVSEPQGWTATAATAAGAQVTLGDVQDGVRRIVIRTEKAQTSDWQVTFRSPSGDPAR